MVTITAYRCMNCGANIKFPKEENESTCEYCAAINLKEDVQTNFQEIEKKMLEKYLDLQNQMNSIQTGDQKDIETRDWIFNRDYKPRIETSFTNITEKFEEYFRKPLFNVTILAQRDRKMNLDEVFGKDGWKPENIKSIISFWSVELNHPALKNMAAKQVSKNYLESLSLRGNLLSNIYWIRGLSIDLTLENTKTIMKFCDKCIDITKKLIKVYSQMGEEYEDEAFFYSYWEKRMELYGNLAKQLIKCIKGNFGEVIQEITQDIESIKQLLEEAKTLRETKPLFILIPLLDGFTTDLSIFRFYQKLVEFIQLIEVKMSFFEVLKLINDYLIYAQNRFNGMKNIPGWDNEWLTRIEAPLEKIFTLLENLAEVTALQKGVREAVILGDADFRFSDEWEIEKIYSNKNLKDSFHVKNKFHVYLPLAVIASYSILTKGFLWMKAGEEFESYLFVNETFNIDRSIEEGGYAKGLTYLDLGLKEKDVKKIKLDEIVGMYEQATPRKGNNNGLFIPATATNKEILEYITKTHELYTFADAKKIEPVEDFQKINKNIGMGSNFERLTGEFLDRVYLPITIVQAAKAKIKKDNHQLAEEYQYYLITPFPANEKDLLNNFLEMEIRPNELTELMELTRVIMKI